jgi:hypothetical protein
MNVGIETFSIYRCFNRFSLQVFFPKIKIGYFYGKNEEEKWYGIKIDFVNDIHFEVYDYGWLFSFIFLGFGIIINKYNV